jgi:hypothetical protein
MRRQRDLVPAPDRRELLAKRRIVGERRQRVEPRGSSSNSGPIASTMSFVRAGIRLEEPAPERDAVRLVDDAVRDRSC